MTNVLCALAVLAATGFAVWVLLRPEREKRKNSVMVFSLVSERDDVRHALSEVEPRCADCKVRRAQERMVERLHRERVSA